MLFLVESANYLLDPLAKLLNMEWLGSVTWGSIIVRIMFSLIFGGAIGVERATKRHAAGFRTYILVCIGSTIAMMVNQYIFEMYGTGDASRLGSQVISGIGFLGAGTILVTSRSQVKGLTTAAGLWACACVGLSIGIGFYTIALLGGIIIIVSLSILPIIEIGFRERSKNIQIHIEFLSEDHLREFIEYVRENNMIINQLEPNHAYDSAGLSVYTIGIEVKSMPKKKKIHQSVIQELTSLPYVSYLEELY